MNAIVLDRLRGIHGQLIAGHKASKSMSASSKGTERELFIRDFLSRVYPPSFRFGSGDATDKHGHRSGQLDVVVEFQWGLSLPAIGSDRVRLYLAETVAAVIEVKSNLANQWSDVVSTARSLGVLTRSRKGVSGVGRKPPENIPLMVVGYEGWEQSLTLHQHVAAEPLIAAALQIDRGFFHTVENRGLPMSAEGPEGLWAFLSHLHDRITHYDVVYSRPQEYVFPQI